MDGTFRRCDRNASHDDTTNERVTPVSMKPSPRSPAARWLVPGAATLLLGALGLLPRSALADDPDARSTAATAVPEFASSFSGIDTAIDLRSSRTGYGALGELGVRWLGTRSLSQRRWVARWELVASAQGGVPGSVLTVVPIIGGRALLDGELGYRLQASRSWSPLVEMRAAGDLEWLAATSAHYSAFSDLTGTNPLSAAGQLRAGLGASYLDASRSLSVVGFVQAAVRPTALHPRGLPFTEGGLALRLDLARSFTMRVDASWGTALSRDTPLRSTDRTTHVELGLGVSKWLTRRLWLGLDATAARDADRVEYVASVTSYSTVAVPDLKLALSVGFSWGGR